MKILIRNGHIIDTVNKRNEISDILVQDGVTALIDKNITTEYSDIVIDAKNKLVLPGLIDMHCHLRDPGYEYKEDIESGTKSAARGGFTTVACMPNTDPVIDSGPMVEYIKNKAKEKGTVNVYPIGAISKGLIGKELAEMGKMKEAGAVAVSDDGNPVSNNILMLNALKYASMFNLTVISHCEDLSIVDGGAMNEGYMSTLLGIKGTPTVAENLVIARDILLSEYTNIPVHIAHVSTKTGVDMIRFAKSRGVKVTCETCPHYFSLTEAAVEGYNTAAKMNPPLRTDDDVKAIKEGLKDGTIDVIATDHAPHAEYEKNVEFSLAKNGIVGFETAFSLSVTNLVNEGVISFEGLVDKFCKNPAKILGINKGSINIKEPADILVADPNEEYKLDINKFVSKSKNSPFDGFMLKGMINYTIVGGKIVYLAT